MFPIKKRLSALVQPCSLLLAVMALGLLILHLHQEATTAKAMLFAGIRVMALLSSVQWPGFWFVRWSKAILPC